MKEYEVLGNRDQLGHAPGQRFHADLPESQERRMVARGAIRVVGEEGTGDTTPAEPEPTVVEETSGFLSEEVLSDEEEAPSEGGGEFGLQADESKEVSGG